MIKEILRQLYNGHRVLVGDGAILVLFIASVIVMLLLSKAGSRRIKPLFLSIPATIGCAMSEFIKAVRSFCTNRAAGIVATIFAIALTFLTCSVSGKMVFSRDLSGRAENGLHIPNSILEAGEAVLADDGTPRVLTMPGWGLYLECISSAFVLMYDDSGADVSSFDEDQMKVYTELTKDSPDMKKIATIARRNGCRYVILSKDMWPERPITGYGYELIFEDDNCGVYREVRTP